MGGLGRKSLLASTIVCWVALGGCRKEPPELRLGFLTNITHAQALVGIRDGTFARGLPEGFSARPFSSGPAVMEALLAGELDMAYVGATPAIIAYVRSGHMLRVVAGAASGGAVLVVRPGFGPRDFKGSRLAAPQIGNTQDVALRHFLLGLGLNASDRPGREVVVLPLSNSEILGLFRRGELDGAWVPEPWGARLVHEAGGRILIDERELWPSGMFPTTVLVATERALERRPEAVKAALRAHQELTSRWRRDQSGFAAEANAAFEELMAQRLSPAVLEEAFSRLEPTVDPMEEGLLENGRRLVELGYLPTAELSGLVARPERLKRGSRRSAGTYWQAASSLEASRAILGSADRPDERFEEAPCGLYVGEPQPRAALSRPHVNGNSLWREGGEEVLVGPVISHCQNLCLLAGEGQGRPDDQPRVDSVRPHLDDLVACEHLHRGVAEGRAQMGGELVGLELAELGVGHSIVPGERGGLLFDEGPRGAPGVALEHPPDLLLPLLGEVAETHPGLTWPWA
jgi:NitT/TauT family transport system substrate-binding protein